jgi:hypothetical protein
MIFETFCGATLAILFVWVSYLHFEWCKFKRNPEKYWEVMLEIRKMKMKKC